MVACAGLAALGSAHALCYVNGALATSGTGGSWATAYNDLQSALTNAACTEIWVASSVYFPSSSSAAGVSFRIGAGVAVYGGFGGGESQRSERDPAANLTVLSGDLGDNDCGAPCPGGVVPDATQIVPPNSFNVVVIGAGTPIGADTVLDGFTITGGDASNYSGGGVYCGSAPGDATTACSPTLANLVFSGNRATFVGGGMYINGESGANSSPTLTRVVFRGNHADNGGAMYADGYSGGTSSPLLTDVTFTGNSATNWGGAIYSDGTSGGLSNPVLAGVTFSGNGAKVGGAMYAAGGGAGGTSNASLTNVTFSGNTASQYGGALFAVGDSGGVSSPTLTNVTFNGNHATLHGGAIESYAGTGTSTPVLTNVILWGDTAGTSAPEVLGDASISRSIVQGGCPSGTSCSNLVAGDPLLGPLRSNGGSTQTLMPGNGGAAIDSGNDVSCPATDQRGVPRPQGAHCDIGSVESDRIFAGDFEAPAG